MPVHVPEPGQFFGGPNSCFKVQRHVVRLHGKLTVLKPDVVKAPPGGTTVRGLAALSDSCGPKAANDEAKAVLSLSARLLNPIAAPNRCGSHVRGMA